MALARSTPQLEINFVPHPGQDEIARQIVKNFHSPHPASIIEIIASRSFGKTVWIVCEILVPYLEQNPGAKVMWVAPTYQTAMSPVEDVFRGIDELTGNRWVPDRDKNGNIVWEFKTTLLGPTLVWHNGASVVFKSADAPDSIVSRGYNRIIIDEIGMISQRVFEMQIMGTARKAGIKIFGIGTPRGKKHWTYPMFLRGQDPSDRDVLSFQAPYHKNPHFSKVLERMIHSLPEWVRRQEYYAEFIDDGDSVIKGLEHVLTGPTISFPSPQQEWSEPITDIEITTLKGKMKIPASDRRFIAGLDLAKSVDFTVLTVLCQESGELVYYRRLNKTDYRQVLESVTDICKQYNSAELVFDATGVGQGLSDILQNYSIVAHPFVFTNDSKNDIVNKLVLSIEYKELSLPRIETMLNELNAFTYSITKTGKISFGAPPGFHDDIVMSLALANWGRKENGGFQNTAMIEDILDLNEGSSDSDDDDF